MNARTLSAAVKLTIFTVVSVVVTGTLVAIMGHFGGGATEEYSAIFSDASLLQSGDDVRVAGVVLGQVKSVEVYGADQAKVVFTVAKDLPLTTASKVEIRYLNLVGDRYLTVTEGRPGAPRLQPGATIPTSRTVPALNLSALFNGFAPLFSALQPKDVNALALNIIKVLQGEGGTIQGLLAHTASLTSSLANRDQLIGEVITNLDQLLGTVNSRHQQLTMLIEELRRWVGGLAQDRVQIGHSIVDISTLTRSLADLLTQGRPLLKGDIAQVRKLASILSRPGTESVLKQVLRDLPEMQADQTRTGTYGSWYSYYLCGASANIKLPSALNNVPGLKKLTYNLKNINFHSTAKRCHLS